MCCLIEAWALRQVLHFEERRFLGDSIAGRVLGGSFCGKSFGNYSNRNVHFFQIAGFCLIPLKFLKKSAYYLRLFSKISRFLENLEILPLLIRSICPRKNFSHSKRSFSLTKKLLTRILTKSPIHQDRLEALMYGAFYTQKNSNYLSNCLSHYHTFVTPRRNYSCTARLQFRAGSLSYCLDSLLGALGYAGTTVCALLLVNDCHVVLNGDGT